MISVMLAISHVVMLSRIAHSSINDKYWSFAENVELTHSNFTRNIFELVLLL